MALEAEIVGISNQAETKQRLEQVSVNQAEIQKLWDELEIVLADPSIPEGDKIEATSQTLQKVFELAKTDMVD